MNTEWQWRKSSYSGPGGNECVEIARPDTVRVGVRDTKDLSRGTIAVPQAAFDAFLDNLVKFPRSDG